MKSNNLKIKTIMKALLETLLGEKIVLIFQKVK